MFLHDSVIQTENNENNELQRINNSFANHNNRSSYSINTTKQLLNDNTSILSEINL